jgi:transcriptional regulator with XRE-family HTH domain
MNNQILLATRESAAVRGDNFAASLFRARCAQNLSLRKLTKLSGVSPAEISKIEHGEVDPHLSNFVALCDALGLSYNDALGVKE